MVRDIAKVIKIRQYFEDAKLIGFTSSREIDHIPDSVFVEVLKDLQADVWVTGGCRGGDSRIAQLLYGLFPSTRHLVVLPANKSQVDEWWANVPIPTTVYVLNMPEDSTYKDRNQMIVDVSDELIGFPIQGEFHPSMRRSGTWQTIRMARKALIPHSVYELGSMWK